MSWISGLFGHRKLYEDLSEEMRLHVEERVEQLKGEGLSAKEARRRARIALATWRW